MRRSALLVLAASLAFALAPFFSGFRDGIDPNLYPVPQDDPPVQPAGWAFAIWTLIYIWLVIHAGFGLWKRAEDPDWQRVRGPLFASLAPGAFWLTVAEISPVWATVLIYWMLLTALVALFRTPPGRDRWLLTAPLAIYAGWLSAASFASLGLLGAGWGVGPGEVGWAFLCIALATALAAGVQLRLGRAPEYGVTVAWALVAIMVKNLGAQPGVAAAAGLAALLMLAAAALAGRRRAHGIGT